KKLPDSRGAALARMVLTLLRVTSPSMVMRCSAKTGWRIAQLPASTRTASAASTNSTLAVACISRTSPGSSAASRRERKTAAAAMASMRRRVERGSGEQLHAQLFVARARGLGRHRHQRMRGHARRGVELDQEGLAVARADHQVGATPAAAAERAIGGHGQSLHLALLSFGQAARAVV